jgi:hypothetical protein
LYETEVPVFPSRRRCLHKHDGPGLSTPAIQNRRPTAQPQPAGVDRPGPSCFPPGGVVTGRPDRNHKQAARQQCPRQFSRSGALSGGAAGGRLVTASTTPCRRPRTQRRWQSTTARKFEAIQPCAKPSKKALLTHPWVVERVEKGVHAVSDLLFWTA